MIKHLIKKNQTALRVLKRIREILRNVYTALFGAIFSLFPINNRKIVACSFYGNDYSDNPKYVIESLLKLVSPGELDIVWALRKDLLSKHQLANGVRAVRYGSIRYLYELATAKVWLDNARKILVPRKRRSQFYIQTWHGSLALKKIEKDAINLPAEYCRIAKRDSALADLFLSGSTSISALYRSAFWYDGEILELGSPRFDRLVSDYKIKSNLAAVKRKVCAELDIDFDNQLLLYAPTFREGVNNTDCYNLDYSQLLVTLAQKFGGQWTILLRLHPNATAIAKSIGDQIKTGVVNASNYPDFYELLGVSDLVISDYSTIGMEATIIDKPVFLYAPDYQQYKTKERGFYIDVKNLPLPFATTNSELNTNILNFDLEQMHKNNQATLKLFGVKESGHSSEAVAKIILEHLKMA